MTPSIAITIGTSHLSAVANQRTSQAFDSARQGIQAAQKHIQANQTVTGLTLIREARSRLAVVSENTQNSAAPEAVGVAAGAVQSLDGVLAQFGRPVSSANGSSFDRDASAVVLLKEAADRLQFGKAVADGVADANAFIVNTATNSLTS